MEGNKAGKMRQQLDEQAWLAVLARFDGAAMRLEEFCRREGLTRSCFARWRTRLRPDLKRTPALAVSRSAALVPTPSFVDLGVLRRTKQMCHWRRCALSLVADAPR